MDIVDWLVSLRRRWVVALVVLLMAAAATWAVGGLVKVRFEAKASLVLLGPNSYVDQEGADIQVNPYARFGGAGEGITGTTLVALLMSPQTVREAEATGFPGEYTVMFNPMGGGAILDLTVTSETPEQSLRGLDRIVQTAQDTLLAQQTDAGAPESSLVRASILTRDEEPESLNGARIRAMGATAVLGVFLALLLTRFLDLRRRKKTGEPARRGSAPHPTDRRIETWPPGVVPGVSELDGPEYQAPDQPDLDRAVSDRLWHLDRAMSRTGPGPVEQPRR